MKASMIFGAAALFSLLVVSPALAANECPGPNDKAWREFRGGSLTAPSAEERGDVLALLAQYAWTMDNRDFDGLAALFADNGYYYHCNPGNKDAVLTIPAASLAQQFQNIFSYLAQTNSSATRQLSNFLIGKTKDGNFEVAFNSAVSIQTIGVSAAQLDYTAKLFATIVTDEGLLKFLVLKVAPTQSGIQASAR